MKLGNKYTVVKECHGKSYHDFPYRTEVTCVRKMKDDHYLFTGKDYDNVTITQQLHKGDVREL